MQYSELIKKAEKILKREKVPDASDDARILAEEASGMDYGHLLMNRNYEVPDEVSNKLQKYINQRVKRIPLQQIIGYTEFMGLKFRVNENVLCPRQDTEVLVETVLKNIDKNDRKKVLDLCTGSGCIAVSIARFSHANVTACDISEKALEVARQNAADNGAEVSFYAGNLYDALPSMDKYDIIVSNPPYIRSDVIEGLMPEVRDHEPRIALDGFEDGLFFYRQIIGRAADYLTPDGHIYLEIGYDQADEVTGILRKSGYEDIQVIKDYSGNDRVVAAKLMSDM